MFEYLLEDLSNIFGKTEISKDERDTKKFGEGYAAEEVRSLSYHALNSYNRYIYQQANTEAAKVRGYRTMALYPEIGEVLEEICDEAVKEDTDGKIVHLRFKDEKFEKGKPRENLLREFDDMFYKRIGVQYLLWDYFYTFLVDGRMYLENIVNEKRKNEGIIGLKKLPATTMDFLYDAKTGKTLEYKQKIGGAFGRGGRENTITFDPAQITFFDYGLYGKTRKHIFGYLEKAKIPYRQLKLLEDSAIIYRIVRAPERLVFKVDVGNMPRHKAEQYVNRMKTAYKRQMSYNPNSASIQQSSNILSMLENFWIPTSSEGRGSNVDVLQGGCLSLDTKIPLLDGRTEKLSTLIEEHNDGKQNWIYSCDPENGEIVPGIISWAGITQKNAEVVKFTLDNGEEIVCTTDHKFPVWERGYTKAENLEIGSSIIPFNTKKEKLNGDTKDYSKVFDHKSKKWKYAHRLVKDFFKENEFVFDEKYSGEKKQTIHHKDFNRFNNNPENLLWMNYIDHFLYHSKGLTEKERRIISKKGNEALRKKLQTDKSFREEYSKKISERMKKWWGSISLKERKIFSERMKKQIQIWKESDEESYLTRQRKNSKLGNSARIKKQNEDEEFRRDIYRISGESLRKTLKMPFHQERMKHIAKNLKFRLDNQTTVFDNFLLQKVIDYYIQSKETYKYSGKEYKYISEVIGNLNKDKGFMDHFQNLNFPKEKIIYKLRTDIFQEHQLIKLLRHYSYKSWRDFGDKIGLYNHKIVKIEYLKERMDVGTLTIDAEEKFHDYHSFALGAGIFTKNSNLGEIEDIVYFMKKLYKSLKYPAQRVLGDQSGVLSHEGRSSSEITRDEVKFAKFIERVQQKFCLAMERLFLLNLELRGTFNRYDLQRDDFEITFNPVSSYREIKDLEMEDARGGVYNTFLGDESISKTFLKKRFLRWSEEDLAENKRVLEEDLKWEKKIAKLRMDVEQAAQPPEAEVGGGSGGEEGGGGGFDTPKGGGEGEGEKPAESKPGKENKI